MSTVAGHALREKRVAVGRYLGAAPAPGERDGYWLRWHCACGEQIGGTKDGMTRARAREVHREHKESVGIVRVTTSTSESAQGPLCGNSQHPDGPWHPSAPLPSYGPLWSRKARQARRRYEKNRARWGCGCDTKERT